MAIHPNKTPLPNTEAPSSETKTRREFSYYDEQSKPIHVCKIIHKNKPLIKIFPYSYSQANGLAKKRISEIELRGWKSESELPKILKPGAKVSVGHKRIYPLMSLLYKRYPKLQKLIVIKNGGTTRFSDTTVTFAYDELENICKAIGKEIRLFEIHRKTTVNNELAAISGNFTKRSSKLTKGTLAHFLAHYGNDVNLSATDIDAILELITHVPFGNISVTENFIETRNQINVAYLDGVIERFEALIDVKSDNEKDWQKFFEEYGWILASVFPYQVLLVDREAYVGGKTIHNAEGRVVDFLFQNGFRDNYALLEIKTHNTELVNTKPYRGPDAYSLHKDCSGAVSQCLDQKNTFLTEMGAKYPILDPKVVLIIGHKGRLSNSQSKSFELTRQNQKNIDMVTFDELLEKLIGLRSILNTPSN